MRRIAVLAGSVVAVLATGAVLAASGGAQDPGGRTINLVTKDFKFKLVDNPPRSRGRRAPPGAGDQLVLSATVLNPTGARVGRLHATCAVTVGGRRGRAVCQGIYDLADGQMHLLVAYTGSADVSGSVVGGTGAYAGARGTFVSKDRPGESGGDPSDDTVTLLP